MSRFGTKILAPVALVVLLAVAGIFALPKFFSSQAPAPQTQQAEVQVLPGSSFNKFFPSGDEQYERIYTQEKQGFAEAKLKESGEDRAMLSVSDTAANPKAADKYRSRGASLAG